MRTTVQIDDAVLALAKKRAREAGLTLGQLVELGLRRELATDPAVQAAPEVPIFDGGTPPSTGINLRSGREIAELFTNEDVDRRRAAR